MEYGYQSVHGGKIEGCYRCNTEGPSDISSKAIGSDILSGSEESNLNKEQEKKRNSHVVPLEVVCQVSREWSFTGIDVFLREAIPFVCLSLGTHNALDLDPKKEGECVRNKEKTFNTDGKYDKERREPKEVHDDLGELVVVCTAMNEWECT